MIVAYSYVSIEDRDVRREFEVAMAARSRLVESFPGFKRFEFRKELGKGGRYVIATWWETRADLRAYMRSPAHHETHSRLTREARAVIAPPRVEIHEVVELTEAAGGAA